MNKVALIGRLTKEPELRKTESGNSILRFNLAVSRKHKKEDGKTEADFINCIAFNKTAELMAKYLNKGNLIAVDGHIQTGNYTNKDGIKIYTTDVIVDNVTLLQNKPKNKEEEKDENPFEKFGEQVAIDDNMLD